MCAFLFPFVQISKCNLKTHCKLLPLPASCATIRLCCQSCHHKPTMKLLPRDIPTVWSYWTRRQSAYNTEAAAEYNQPTYFDLIIFPWRWRRVRRGSLILKWLDLTVSSLWQRLYIVAWHLPRGSSVRWREDMSGGLKSAKIRANGAQRAAWARRTTQQGAKLLIPIRSHQS